MKKSIFIILVFFVLVFYCNAQTAPVNKKLQNRIDDIKTAADIEKLLESIDKKRFESFTVNEALKFEKPECNDLSKKIDAKPWIKADFDNNGSTDILVNGKDYDTQIIVIMAAGENKYEVKYLTKRSFQECALASVESYENGEIINYKGQNDAERDKRLIYKFGDFVEINDAPRNYKIEKIEYSTGMCFGTCPAFDLIINADRTAAYNANQYNKTQGKFKGTILQNNFDALVGLLNYIDFPSLKDNYSVTWTDDQTSNLTITYDGGKIKKIRDYGLIGTFGLSRVYKILFDLRENQTWK